MNKRLSGKLTVFLCDYFTEAMSSLKVASSTKVISPFSPLLIPYRFLPPDCPNFSKIYFWDEFIDVIGIGLLSLLFTFLLLAASRVMTDFYYKLVESGISKN